MSSPINIHSVPEVVAKAMQLAISELVWVDTLPGYRELSKKYAVSKDAIFKALAILEAGGIIGSAEKGKRRKINGKASLKIKKSMRLLVVKGKSRGASG